MATFTCAKCSKRFELKRDGQLCCSGDCEKAFRLSYLARDLASPARRCCVCNAMIPADAAHILFCGDQCRTKFTAVHRVEGE